MTVKSCLSGSACGHSSFKGRKAANVSIAAVPIEFHYPMVSALVPSDANRPRRVCYRKAPIEAVFLLGTITKVGQTIVRWISVCVVNHDRVIPMRPLPTNTMDQVSLAKNSHGAIALPVADASLSASVPRIPSLACARLSGARCKHPAGSMAPNERSIFRVEVEKPAQEALRW